MYTTAVYVFLTAWTISLLGTGLSALRLAGLVRQIPARRADVIEAFGATVMTLLGLALELAAVRSAGTESTGVGPEQLALYAVSLLTIAASAAFIGVKLCQQIRTQDQEAK
jgi:hypothetical protein